MARLYRRMRTSRIIAGFEDPELGVRRNALALTQFAEPFNARILPLLARFDFRRQPEFYRQTLCTALARVLTTRTSAGT